MGSSSCAHKKKGRNGECCNDEETLDFERQINIENAAWDEAGKFNGPLEYYTKRNGCHSSLCIRRHEHDSQHTTGILVELIIRKANTVDKKWFVQIRSLDWDSEKGGKRVWKHNWNGGTVVIAIARCAEQFGKYTKYRNNCNTFIKKVVEHMSNNDPSRDQALSSESTFGDLHTLLSQSKIGISQVAKSDLVEVSNDCCGLLFSFLRKIYS
jgi:hypothetical protein